MRARVAFARSLLQLGGFIQSLAIMVMRPRDLLEFSRQNYSKPKVLEIWGDESRICEGLYPVESALLEKVPVGGGRFLVLAAGGGRDSISLAQRGFDVTGVDFVPEMVEKAKENAAKRGLNLSFLVQDISELDMAADTFDVVWCSGGLYSSIPTARKRVETLNKIRRCLKPGGHFVFFFHWGKRSRSRPMVELVRRIIATLTRGNLSYEKGDFLAYNSEFVHAFSSQEEIRSELEAGGFEVVKIDLTEVNMCEESKRGDAVVRR